PGRPLLGVRRGVGHLRLGLLLRGIRARRRVPPSLFWRNTLDERVNERGLRRLRVRVARLRVGDRSCDRHTRDGTGLIPRMPPPTRVLDGERPHERDGGDEQRNQSGIQGLTHWQWTVAPWGPTKVRPPMRTFDDSSGAADQTFRRPPMQLDVTKETPCS